MKIVGRGSSVTPATARGGSPLGNYWTMPGDVLRATGYGIRSIGIEVFGTNYAIAGNRLELRVPREALDLALAQPGRQAQLAQVAAGTLRLQGRGPHVLGDRGARHETDFSGSGGHGVHLSPLKGRGGGADQCRWRCAASATARARCSNSVLLSRKSSAPSPR